MRPGCSFKAPVRFDGIFNVLKSNSSFGYFVAEKQSMNPQVERYFPHGYSVAE